MNIIELIDGVGEPAHHIMSNGQCIGYYSAEQLAGVVAKAKQERIAELESERDMWKATAEAVVDFEKAQMRLRIESLEFTMKLALEALNRANTILAELTFSDWIPRTDTPSIDIRQRINAAHVIASSSISKCKEVLHG